MKLISFTGDNKIELVFFIILYESRFFINFYSKEKVLLKELSVWEGEEEDKIRIINILKRYVINISS